MATTTRHHIEISRIDTSGNLFILYPKNTLKDVYTSSTSGVTIEGKINFFGTCNTAADTAAKTVSISGFSLTTGSHLTVVFTNGISVANATLNVNGTGEKEIYFEGTALKANAVRAKARVHMVYDGSYFHILSGASNAAYVSNANTTKFYLLGTPTNAAGSPGTEHFDTGVYVSTTAGQLVANTIQANTFYLGGTSASINSTNYTGQAATVGTISSYLVDSCESGTANGVTTKALTANQGYLLQNQINTLNSNFSNYYNKNRQIATPIELAQTPSAGAYSSAPICTNADGSSDKRAGIGFHNQGWVGAFLYLENDGRLHLILHNGTNYPIAYKNELDGLTINLNEKTKWKYIGYIAQNGKVSINEEFNELLVCLLDENKGIYHMRISAVIPFHYVESTPTFEVNTYITERAYATLVFNNSTKELTCTTLSGKYIKFVGVYYR